VELELVSFDFMLGDGMKNEVTVTRGMRVHNITCVIDLTAIVRYQQFETRKRASYESKTG
jgi:hypothetical protein